jgi:rhamnulose-1-phosphate aldolase
MVCGTDEIGEATAEAIKSARVVIWTMHGIYGAGKDLDEVFGLIETVEKACQLYMMTQPIGRIHVLTDDNLRALVKRFNLSPRKGIID